MSAAPIINPLNKSENPIYILMISMHGLIRGNNMELGRDADTGGQTTYVIELARALAKHHEVDKVDLLTRLVDDVTSAMTTTNLAKNWAMAPTSSACHSGPNVIYAKNCFGHIWIRL
jgi:hypothetical protein